MNRSQDIPPRFASALQRLDGEASLLCEMAAITSEDLPEVQEKTEAALADGDCEQAASGLHKLKGMLSTFDADGVVLEIQEILDAARNGRVDDARRGYREQKSEIDALTRDIAKLARDTA